MKERKKEKEQPAQASTSISLFKACPRTPEPVVIKRALGAAAQDLESPGPCSLPHTPHCGCPGPGVWWRSSVDWFCTRCPVPSAFSHPMSLVHVSQQSPEPATSPACCASQEEKLTIIRGQREPAGWTPKEMSASIQYPVQLLPGTGWRWQSFDLSILTQSMLPYLNIPIVPIIILKNCVCAPLIQS